MLVRPGLHTGGCRAWRRACAQQAAKSRARRARRVTSLAASMSMSLAAASMASIDEAGVPTADVHVQAEHLSEFIGEPPDRVMRVLSRYPVSLAVLPSQLAASTLSLADTLRIEVLTALLMVLKRPVLLQQAAQDVLAHVTDIAHSLNMDVQDTASLLARQPLLLDLPTDALIADMTRLATALDVPLSGLLLVLSRTRPPTLNQLLSMDSQAVKSQAQDLQNVIGSHFGQQQARVTQLFITRCPDLLLSSCADVESTLVALARLLKLPARRLLLLISRCPALLTMTSSALLHNMRGALAALRINQGAVTDICVAEPRLLQLEPQVLRARVDGMLFNLYLSRSQVLDMVVRQPQLLLYQPATLQAHMSGLMRILAVQHEVVQSLLQLQPNLLLFSTQMIQDKLLVMQRLFGLTPLHARQLVTHNPRLLSFSNARLAQSREVLMDVLQIPELQLPMFLLVHPSLVLAPPNKVRGKVRDLAALLALKESQEMEAGALLRVNPTLLNQEAALWQTNFDTITSQLGLSVNQAREAVRRKPLLLGTDPKKLLDRCTTVAKYARSHPCWRAQLESAEGGQVLSCLLCTDDVLARLQWLTIYGMQTKHRLLESRVYSPAFERMYPQFCEWLQQHRPDNFRRAQASLVSERPSVNQHHSRAAAQLQQGAAAVSDNTLQVDDQLVEQLMDEFSLSNDAHLPGPSGQVEDHRGRQSSRGTGHRQQRQQAGVSRKSVSRSTSPAGPSGGVEGTN